MARVLTVSARDFFLPEQVKNTIRNRHPYGRLFYMKIISVAVLGLFLSGCAHKVESVENLSCKMHSGLCYLDASLNGSRPLQLILDSGSSFTVVNAETSQDLNLYKVSEGFAAGPGSTSSGKYTLYNKVSLRIGKILLADQAVISLPFNYVSARVGVPTDGTVGASLFKKYIVKMNYQAGAVEFFNPSEFTVDKGYLQVPLEFEGDVPVISVNIKNRSGKSINGRFIVDTGQFLSGLVISALFHKNNPAVFESLKSSPLQNISAVGGRLQYQKGSVDSVAIGSLEIGTMPTAFLHTAAGIYSKTDIAGGIGPEVLKNFDVIFDYAGKSLWLRPIFISESR